MSEITNSQDSSAKDLRKPYHTPRLKSLGSIDTLVRSGAGPGTDADFPVDGGVS